MKWILPIALMAWSVSAEVPWRFLLLADWHQAEKYTQSENNPDSFAEAEAEDVATVRMLKRNYGGDLILMPGDSNSGHWDRPAFIKNNFPGATPEEAILKAGHLCYSGMIDSFRKGGYPKLIMAVGDHELGDNPWPAGSAVSRCQPQFREAFAREFNTHPDSGRFLYETPVGKAASRPLGTPYENTSYACRHKNVLFVTIDIFHQENPGQVIGAEGTVTGTVTGAHLQWLEQVLSEARKDAGIRYIFVQAHLPVIHPVRKVNSSGMLVDHGMDSPFWKLLRQYRVDLYFAGEVHANTVTKDPESTLVQLVSRGNFFSNFQSVDISDDRIEVACYNHVGLKTSDAQYQVSGRLLIDKSGGATQVRGEGELAVLDPSSRLIHFDFEETVPLASHPIMGMDNRKKEDPAMVRGVKCADLFPNRGAIGSHYSALTARVKRVNGVRGKAGEFDESSRMAVFAMGPHQGEHAVSYALWVQTASPANQLVINSGSIWGRELKGFFNLDLNNGVPEVMVSESQKLVADGFKLNDGKWHHLAVTMPTSGCRLSEVLVYVDGRTAKTRVEGADLVLHFNQAVRLGFGGLNYSNKAFDKLPVTPFVGCMDEVSLWARGLDAGEVRELARRAVSARDANEPTL